MCSRWKRTAALLTLADFSAEDMAAIDFSAAEEPAVPLAVEQMQEKGRIAEKDGGRERLRKEVLSLRLL